MKLQNASAEELLAFMRNSKIKNSGTVIRKAPTTRLHKSKVVKGERELNSDITPVVESTEALSVFTSDSTSASQEVSSIESLSSFSEEESLPLTPKVITAEELWKNWVSNSESLIVDPRYIIGFMPKEHLSPSMLKRYNENPKYAIKLNYGDRSCIGMMPIGGHSGNAQSVEYDRFARMLHFEWLSQGRPAADEAGSCSFYFDTK